MKANLIRFIIGLLNKRYPFLMREVVVGTGKHIHADPRKRPKATAIVTFPQPGVAGIDE